MKKLLIGIGLLAFFGFMIWIFCENPDTVTEAQAQYGAESLRHIYTKSTTIVVDNANGTNTGVIPITMSASYGGYGVAWGSFCAYIEVDTLAAKTGKISAQDSLTLYFKELKSYTSSTSYDKSDYDSTALISNFDWNHGYTKKLTIAPDVCYGFEFRVTHTTIVDDSIQVTITLLYQ